MRWVHALAIVAALGSCMTSASAQVASLPPAFQENISAAREAAKARKYSESVAAYERALRFAPAHVQALAEFSEVLLEAGMRQRAQRVAEKALGQEKAQSDTRKASLLWTLARTSQQLGQTDQAREQMAASLAYKENAEVRASLKRLGGAPQETIQSAPPKIGLANPTNLPERQATSLSGPFPTLNDFCNTMRSKGVISGELACNPASPNFVGGQVPLGFPIYEALYFAPTPNTRGPYLIATRLEGGWWGTVAKDALSGSRDNYELSTISSITRSEPPLAVVALRVRHRHFEPTSNPNDFDITDKDSLLVCGVTSAGTPGCVPEEGLGAPNQNSVTLDSEGAIHMTRANNTSSFVPRFPK